MSILAGIGIALLVFIPLALLGLHLGSNETPIIAALGWVIFFAPACAGIIGAIRMDLNNRRARRALAARSDTRVAALSPARAEIEVSPRWWDAKYQELVRKQIPRDPAAHEGHDIDEPVLAWSGDVLAAEWCSTCHVPIERPPDG